MKKWYNIFRYIAVFGNIIFIIWILYNGFDESFKGSIVQIISYLGLIVLLVLNIVLICRNKF